ncbi:hydrolase [Methyloversatilis sp.]|uniref:hydrolase n=1 Tax=Methyloversatilis sp. TaxID=2569862 RepID=UPI00273575B2|nr:hydrolase [Methyloversatilis sp.]MDP2868397.1 hydrolase [Methyloversatilis sp.]MDP3455707.1 hydrolase [Methyloversatilis sp.]MDP3579659.1 hydrolase [Methyloversatilis sp.]
MRIKPCESVLLVIDLQGRLLPAIDDGQTVLENATWLVDVAQAISVPILATEQYPQGLGPTEAGLRARFPDGTIVEKTHFSALAESSLLRAPEAGRRQWVVVGTEAHVCVQQTVLDRLAMGRQVFVVEDAVGSRRPRDKALALQRMQQNGAEIVSREMVAFEWLEQAGTPLFRAVLERFIR